MRSHILKDVSIQEHVSIALASIALHNRPGKISASPENRAKILLDMIKGKYVKSIALSGKLIIKDSI